MCVGRPSARCQAGFVRASFCFCMRPLTKASLRNSSLPNPWARHLSLRCRTTIIWCTLLHTMTGVLQVSGRSAKQRNRKRAGRVGARDSDTMSPLVNTIIVSKGLLEVLENLCEHFRLCFCLLGLALNVVPNFATVIPAASCLWSIWFITFRSPSFLSSFPLSILPSGLTPL
jgi:hypothetical protein